MIILIDRDFQIILIKIIIQNHSLDKKTSLLHLNT